MKYLPSVLVGLFLGAVVAYGLGFFGETGCFLNFTENFQEEKAALPHVGTGNISTLRKEKRAVATIPVLVAKPVEEFQERDEVFRPSWVAMDSAEVKPYESCTDGTHCGKLYGIAGTLLGNPGWGLGLLRPDRNRTTVSNGSDSNSSSGSMSDSVSRSNADGGAGQTVRIKIEGDSGGGHGGGGKGGGRH